MAAPGNPLYPASKLDANQVLQHSYIDEAQRIRVDAEATIVNADIDVALSFDEDSVAIADKDGNYLKINPDGSLNIVVSTEVAKVLSSKYQEVSGVATGVTTLIGTFTAGTNTYLQKIEFSGTNIAEYELVIGGTTQDKRRTYFGSSLDGKFDFDSGLKLTSGQVVQVYVIHGRSSFGDFNTRIQTLEG